MVFAQVVLLLENGIPGACLYEPLEKHNIEPEHSGGVKHQKD